MVKSKPKALQHFKVDPVLKIYETFYKQAESMCTCPQLRLATASPLIGAISRNSAPFPKVAVNVF